jgi:hypothetical protein
VVDPMKTTHCTGKAPKSQIPTPKFKTQPIEILNFGHWDLLGNSGRLKLDIRFAFHYQSGLFGFSAKLMTSSKAFDSLSLERDKGDER